MNVFDIKLLIVTLNKINFNFVVLKITAGLTNIDFLNSDLIFVRTVLNAHITLTPKS